MFPFKCHFHHTDKFILLPEHNIAVFTQRYVIHVRLLNVDFIKLQYRSIQKLHNYVFESPSEGKTKQVLG